MSHREPINWDNATLEEVEVAMRCAPTQQGFLRLQAIHLLLRGYSEEEVSDITQRSMSNVNRLKYLFNARGIDGIAVRKRSGRPRKIAAARFQEEFVPLVLDPASAQEQHWTGVKFHGYLREQAKIDLGYSTLLRYFREYDLRLLCPRKWPERQDPEARKAFCNELAQLSKDASVELWFMDECGVEGDPRPRRRWVQKGSRPKQPYFGDHIRTNVAGAVAPVSGNFFSLIVPHSDALVFQVFLDHFACATKESEKQIILVLDNASWHKKAGLNWHHIKPLFLPAYSPDLNPIEQLWRCLKEKFFNGWVAKTPQMLDERLRIKGTLPFFLYRKG